MPEIRQFLNQSIGDYINRVTDEERSLMLVRASMGAGKSRISLSEVQDYARSGAKILWLAPQRKQYENLRHMEIFDENLWFEWLPRQEEPIKTCNFCQEQYEWLKKGYRGIDLCKQLCKDVMSNCHFLTQADTVKGQASQNNGGVIVFGTHQYLIYTPKAIEFDLVIVDEGPLPVFPSELFIPSHEILLTKKSAPAYLQTSRLMSEIAQSLSKGEVLKGKQLFEKIGRIFSFELRKWGNYSQSLTGFLGQV